MKRKISMVFGLLFSIVAIGQKKDFGSWNVINTGLTLSEKWSLFNELQVRSQSFYDNHFYYEIKGGVSYSLNKNFSFLLGIGKYKTFTDGGSFKQPVTANEFRFWQQLTMNHFLDRIKFEHRYRVEHRWFKETGFRNRFRYRLNAVVPINRRKVEAGTVYASSFNEIFLTNKKPYFERNRFFIGAGYQFNDVLTIQPGYCYQYDFKNDVGAGKHFFQFTLMIDLEAHRSDVERIPGNID